MKAIIVAGGRGERLKPITNTIPKPMVEVNGKPILLHIINLFKKHGISEFVIALCYLPEVIVSYFGNGSKFGVNISYTLENPTKPLGTAGAITLTNKHINETFIVTYADILRDLNIKEMITEHRNNKSLATLNVYKRISKDAKSIIEFDKNKRITKFLERPNKRALKNKYIWSNGSFYIFEPDIFKFIEKNKKSDFGLDIFPKLLLKKKPLYAYPTSNYFIDVGTNETLTLAEKAFSKV